MAKKQKEILFCDYFEEWVEVYKVGAIAKITLAKYYNAAKQLRDICPKLFISDFDRREYQRIINVYAETHEKQTVKDFHHHVKACIKDLFHDGLIDKDPTYRVVIKGAEPTRAKKRKFLQKEELSKLLQSLDTSQIGFGWFVMLVAKTGMRYAEALAITPADFDWTAQTISINKTWDYKYNKGFAKTKTLSSVRTIKIDWQIVGQYTNLNDKNGKKIFDGDRCWNDYEEEYGIVSFDEGKFIFTFDNVCVDLFEVADDLEVVGTIHDLEVSE